ncbi:MAG: hypothetical protein KF831_16130 [Acidobacteria bacterium]|nr:hypothetical protein [Acidobacteriota bacterium]
MAEWWLIDDSTQDRIASYINVATDRVIANFGAHGNENSLTAALGQELNGKRLSVGDTTVSFGYRNFLEQKEEPLTGADGGFLVTITNNNEVVEKGVFFQAKRFPEYKNIRSLNLNRREASRLKQQLEDMLKLSDQSILLGQTNYDFYAVQATSLVTRGISELRFPFRNAQLLTLGTYLGKWVARCTKGDTRKSFIQGIRNPKGFLNNLITMNVHTKQPPFLTEGGKPIDLNSLPRDRIPRPRWRSES